MHFLQEIKHAPSSVRMVYDEAQVDHLLPDVYLDQAIQPMQPLWITLIVAGVVLLFLSMLFNFLNRN